MGMTGTQRGAAAAAMRSVLSLNIRERTALYAAYIPWVEGGGIFIPTTRPYKLADEVSMLLTLMDDPNRIAVQKGGLDYAAGHSGRARAGHPACSSPTTGRAAKGHRGHSFWRAAGLVAAHPYDVTPAADNLVYCVAGDDVQSLRSVPCLSIPLPHQFLRL